MVLDVSPETAGHIAVALRAHQQWAARTGIRVPEGVGELAEACASAARSRQAPTALEQLWQAAQGERVTPRLLTYDETATTLACSVRQVERLVSCGDLPAVRVGAGASRVRVVDLDAYVEALIATKGRSAA